VSAQLDHQFQPPSDRNTSWVEFFGSRNLVMIEEICRGQIEMLGYPVSGRWLAGEG